jgi:glycosyltransferase involved in cell wall biosynthesis
MIKKVLIIGYVWPEPNSSAAGQRMLQLINSFLNNQFEVVFATQAHDSQFAFNLATLNIETFKISVNDSSFDSFVKNQNPTVVMFDRFIMEEQFGWRVAEQCPDALRILDTEDLHFLRKERQQKLNQKVEKERFSAIAKREIASIYRCDLTLIISEFEMELLTVNYQVPKERLMYMPMWSDSVSNIHNFTERKHFMFIGNFMHEPNWDCVRHLKNEIWPSIRKKLPDSELHVYGAYPTDKVFQLNNEKEGFIIKGRAEDVNQICQNYRLMVAPLRFGAGVKGKFIDAMRNGLPSITTILGAESMIEKEDWPGYVSDEIQDIISNAIEIYSNEQLWNDLSNKAFKVHNEKFTDKKWSEIFVGKVIDYIQNLESIRKNNFTGAMLMHHTQQSTKFMSKWIELKNQL